jgi:hypothetical protein
MDWLPCQIRTVAGTDKETKIVTHIQTFYKTLDDFDFSTYVNSFYSTMMIVLGGDIGPTNKLESFFLSAVCFIGQTTIAVIFANVSLIIVKMNRK